MTSHTATTAPALPSTDTLAARVAKFLARFKTTTSSTWADGARGM